MGSVLRDVSTPLILEEGNLQYFSREEENQREFLSLQIAFVDIHHLFILAGCLFVFVFQLLDKHYMFVLRIEIKG